MSPMPPAKLPDGVPLLALRPLRSECRGCGTCCHGWQVELAEDEPPRIAEQARALGVAEPIVDGVLRRQDGRCVFLDDALRCRIHATFGSDAKPRVCRIYPLRAVFTEDGLRVGVDPSCTSTIDTWEDGPQVEPLRTIEQIRQLDPALIEDERALLALASNPKIDVAHLAGALVRDPAAAPELPAGLVRRLLERLRADGVAEALLHPRRGAVLLGHLAHLPPALARLSPDAPPRWSGRLSAAHQAFALEVFRRHVFLRLGDPTVPPVAQALLLLAGILACAWADPGERFGPALSAWARVIRGPAVWGVLVPDSTAAYRILTGGRE